MNEPLDCSQLLRDLLDETGASRATLRLDVARMNFPVVAEALTVGVLALSGTHSLDQRNLDTVRYLFETKDLLIQNDLEVDVPRASKALIEAYGVVSQMLAPIIFDEEVLGWISVHQCAEKRHWSDGDIAALKAAAGALGAGFLGHNGLEGND